MGKLHSKLTIWTSFPTLYSSAHTNRGSDMSDSSFPIHDTLSEAIRKASNIEELNRFADVAKVYAFPDQRSADKVADELRVSTSRLNAFLKGERFYRLADRLKNGTFGNKSASDAIAAGLEHMNRDNTKQNHILLKKFGEMIVKTRLPGSRTKLRKLFASRTSTARTSFCISNPELCEEVYRALDHQRDLDRAA